MSTIDDVRAVALGFPDATEVVLGQRGGTGWRAKSGLFVWERGPSGADVRALADLGREWPAGPTVGVRVDGEEGKRELLASLPDQLFTIPHFDGYPAVLVRLDVVDAGLLAELITDSWLLRTARRTAAEWIAAHGDRPGESGTTAG
jgi:hypothetical protein